MEFLLEPAAFAGKNRMSARQKLLNIVNRKGLAERKASYKLRDWIFSRQRYWGEPIPLIHCANMWYCASPEDQLPVILPDVEKYEPTGTGESPLAAIDIGLIRHVQNVAGRQNEKPIPCHNGRVHVGISCAIQIHNLTTNHLIKKI